MRSPTKSLSLLKAAVTSASVSFLLIASAAYASPVETPSPLIDCLDGAYDLGPEAAALGFQCADDAQTSGQAQMVICRRETLINKGYCTGEAHPISCAWQIQEESWLCSETGTYPFTAWIKRTSPQTVSYKFRSSFNEGELTGRLLDLE